jgi:hypothetical protein
MLMLKQIKKNIVDNTPLANYNIDLIFDISSNTDNLCFLNFASTKWAA